METVEGIMAAMTVVYSDVLLSYANEEASGDAADEVAEEDTGL